MTDQLDHEHENDDALHADLPVSSLFSVEGKVVLVTGGGSGIGAMIASGFVQNGCRVYIASRKDTSSYARALTQRGPGSCTSVSCDISEPLQQQKLIDTIRQAEGRLHVLVNNSATNHIAPIGKHDPKMFEEVTKLNASAVFSLTQFAMPLLEAAGTSDDPARVINISSIGGLKVSAVDMFAYCASKAAVLMLSKHLAGAVGPRHITVNCICPGPFMSRMLVAGAGSVKRASDAGRITALGRLGGPSDVAGATIFLSSKAGSYVTGTEFTLDGGSIVARRAHL